MKPSRWPDELNDVMAKSTELGGETLAQHTWEVLHKLAELHHLRPNLAQLVGAPQLWHCLFWTCLLHDFGKAACGFQDMLAGRGRWKQRHEVLSLAFFDWIADALDQDERRWIVAAIVSHHRDAVTIQQQYANTDPDPLAPLFADLDPAVVGKLWRWIDTCAADWITALGFTPREVRPLPLMPYDQAVALVRQRGVARMRYWLSVYEPGRLALMLALVRYLREGYGARFFVMSATFPQIIREKLAIALGPHATITADSAVFQKFRRHRLHLLDGGLLEDGIGRIVYDVRAGRQVLACANTVRRAQQVRDALLAAGLAPDQVLLIHSRYIITHRTEREEMIADRCRLDLPAADRRPFVLVATQVVEVSLNIDLDTIYTDPAPLEALLQRFGRVNRACTKGICPVHVFKEPCDGQGVYGRHKDQQQQGHSVRVTLAELERHDGETIEEAQINDWLDRIYGDPSLAAQWQEEYRRLAQIAEQLLAGLRPFNSDPQKEDAFEALFDNVDVLPERFERSYLECLQNDAFIEASRYFVGISARKYAELARKGLVRPVDDPESKHRKWVVKLRYDDDMGLLFDQMQADADWD